MLLQPPVSHGEIPLPAPYPTSALNATLVSPTCKGNPETWLLAQITRDDFFQAWGEFGGYWSMHLGQEKDLISQTQRAYTSLCGHSRQLYL